MIKTVTLNPAVDKTVEIDQLRIGEVNRISTLRLDAGGKGINVAKTIQSLGGECTATGLLAGRNGEWIKACLDQMGISNDFLFVKGETRTNLKVADRQSGTITDINEPGLIEITEAHLVRLGDKIFHDMKHDDILVLSGSVPTDVPMDIYRVWTKRAAASGIKVVLDADAKPLEEGLKAEPDLVKPNLAELESLLERRLTSLGEIVRAGHLLLDRGAKAAAVSLGAEGAIFLDGESVIHAEGIKAVVRSTVGAGDAMTAALVVGIDKNYPFAKSAALSVAAGTAKAEIQGTQAPDLKAVHRFETQVRLKYL